MNGTLASALRPCFPKPLAFAAVILATQASFVTPTEAQEASPLERSSAESFFEEGRHLMELKDYAEACLAFENSLRLDRAAGTLLNLARCYELAGRTASAWAAFAEAEDLDERNGDSERAAVAAENKKRLAPLVPKILISVVGKTDKTIVELDGAELDPLSRTFPRPLDPGKHTLFVREEGKEPLEHIVEIRPTQHGVREVVVGPLRSLEPAPSARLKETPPPQKAPADRQEPVSERPASAQEGEGGHRLHPAWGISLASIGVIGAAVGTGFAVDAYHKADTEHCDSDNRCDPKGIEIRDDARDQLTLSYVAAGIGVALVATGIGLTVWSLKTRDGGAQVALEPGPTLQGFLSFRGSF